MGEGGNTYGRLAKASSKPWLLARSAVTKASVRGVFAEMRRGERAARRSVKGVESFISAVVGEALAAD